jgi:energy-coupling factor transport system substrate-specific component
MIVQVLNGFGLSQSISVFLVQVGTDYLDRVIGVYVVAIVYRTLLSRIKLV